MRNTARDFPNFSRHSRLLTMPVLSSRFFLNRAIAAGIAVVMIAGASRLLAQTTANENESYSSSTQYQLAAEMDTDGSGAPSPQYGNGGYGQGRGGYHSSYNDRWSHLAFVAGGGFNAPVGNDTSFITWGGNFTLGAGWQFNKQFGTLLEYQFMDNKLPGSFLSQVSENSNLGFPIGGHSHIWSFTLAPIFYLRPHGALNAYVTGGGGFYRKVTSFTQPVASLCFDPFIGYFTCTQNVTIGHFSSNQGGLNFGVGITHTLGQGQRAKVFAEARYLWINTPGPHDVTYWGLGSTGLIPVTFGIRW
jgi:Outer membrane protein beta-barrel domain